MLGLKIFVVVLAFIAGFLFKEITLIYSERKTSKKKSCCRLENKKTEIVQRTPKRVIFKDLTDHDRALIECLGFVKFSEGINLEEYRYFRNL